MYLSPIYNARSLYVVFFFPMMSYWTANSYINWIGNLQRQFWCEQVAAVGMDVALAWQLQAKKKGKTNQKIYIV